MSDVNSKQIVIKSGKNFDLKWQINHLIGRQPLIQVFMDEPAFGAEGTCFTSKKAIAATNDFNPSSVKIWLQPNADSSPGQANPKKE